MKTWIVRVALRLVPPDWRATVDEDLQDVAEAENRGTAWSAWQAGRAGLRMRSARIVDGSRFDLQCAARSLLRARWFTYGAVLTFALGIGVNVAVFTAVDRVLFRELPYERPDEIVVLREVGQRRATVRHRIGVAGRCRPPAPSGLPRSQRCRLQQAVFRVARIR